MPAQVLVVKRARRRAFAILWAAPSWLRSAWSALREGSGEAGHSAVGARLHPDAAAEASAPMRVPRLRLGEEGGHACTGCGRCPEICPSRCLTLEVLEPEGASGSPVLAQVFRFELDLGACIGCSRCVEVCPEGALENANAPRVMRPSINGLPDPVDLLALGER